MTLYLSRLRLLRDPSIEALKALLQPDDPAQRMDADHRLIWTAFAGDPEARREFLWRAEGNGCFHVLSARVPSAGRFFEEPEVKPFAPALAPGDRLSFILRVNATRARARKDKPSQRVDIVMDALFAMKGDAVERRAARMPVARREAIGWMSQQGEQNGFVLALDKDDQSDLTVADYSVMALPGHRGPRKGQPQFGVLDLTGSLTLTDPAAFTAKLGQGYGRAKSFGCGLMMIRRDRTPG
jgi:CRISPR system Cascade subunit CasE